MTDGDVERMMADASIIRNRRKIEATLQNTRQLSEHLLAQLVWKHQPRHHHRLRRWADGRMTSPESGQLARGLREVGFRHVGPVVAHSFMETVGIETGHFEGCFRAVPPPAARSRTTRGRCERDAPAML